MSVESQKKELIGTWARQLNSWMRSVKANGNKKRVAISLLTQHETSVGYRKLNEFGGDHDALWNWFLKNIENDIAEGLKGGIVQSADPPRTFEFELLSGASGGGGGTHALLSDKEYERYYGSGQSGRPKKEEGGYEYSEVLEYIDNGDCNAKIEIGLFQWNKNKQTSQGRKFNNIITLHEFGHHYKFLMGCFSAKRTAEGQFAESERVSEQTDQQLVIYDIYSDNGGQKVFVENHTKGLAANDLNWMGPNQTKDALKDIEERGYYLWECVALDEGTADSYFSHAQSLPEQTNYFTEWLQGHPMTHEHYDKLYSGRNMLMKFDWANGSCQQVGRMKQAVGRVTRYHGVSFRFAGLIDLNLNVGKKTFVSLVNDLAKSVSVGVQAPADKGSRQSYDADSGTRVAGGMNSLIKLANTFDSAGLINYANRIDAVIRFMARQE